MCLLIAAFLAGASAQEFEAVSLRPNSSPPGHWSMRSDRGMLTATNISLKNMIIRAYGLKDYQIEGPDWLDSVGFDLVAKFPDGVPDDPSDRSSAMQRLMMQKMLADRFSLVVHKRLKNFPAYVLTTAKGGIRFSEVQEPGSHSTANNGHYTGSVTMSDLVEFLEWPADLPVVDMTGLKGRYSITFDWAPAQLAYDPSGKPAWEYLRGAMEDKLGLRIENRTVPIETLVVDRVEKSPADN